MPVSHLWPQVYERYLTAGPGGRENPLEWVATNRVHSDKFRLAIWLPVSLIQRALLIYNYDLYLYGKKRNEKMCYIQEEYRQQEPHPNRSIGKKAG